MPWTSANGVTFPFPHAVWAKIVQSPRLKRDDVMDALRYTQEIHREAMSLSARVVELENEVTRLKHENEFMVRLITEQDR